MQYIYFDLTQIKKLYFDSSYFFTCTWYYWEVYSMFESRFLHLVFIEIYLIISNSYDIVMTGYNMHTMIALCVLNDYVSFYKVIFIIYLPLKVSMSCSDFEPSTALVWCEWMQPLTDCAMWHLAEIGIGCSYISIFIHSDINW